MGFFFSLGGPHPTARRGGGGGGGGGGCGGGGVWRGGGLAKPPVIRLEDGSRGVQVGVKFPVSQHVGVYGMMTHLPSITGHVELGHGYTMPFTLTARPVYNVGVSIDVPVGRKRDR